jgi:hypothetical protein
MRSTRYRLAVLAALLLPGCSDAFASGDCGRHLQTRNATVSVSHQGAPVADFDFTQTGPPEGCAEGDASASLVIRGTTSRPVAFTYVVRKTTPAGDTAWTYTGSVARLAPSQSIAAGTLSTHRSSIKFGIVAVDLYALANVP